MAFLLAIIWLISILMRLADLWMHVSCICGYLCVHVHVRVRVRVRVHTNVVVHGRVVMFKDWFQSFVLVFNMLNFFSMSTMFYLDNTLFSKDQYISSILLFSFKMF